jgi:hypothetical protein
VIQPRSSIVRLARSTLTRLTAPSHRGTAAINQRSPRLPATGAPEINGSSSRARRRAAHIVIVRRFAAGNANQQTTGDQNPTTARKRHEAP